LWTRIPLLKTPPPFFSPVLSLGCPVPSKLGIFFWHRTPLSFFSLLGGVGTRQTFCRKKPPLLPFLSRFFSASVSALCAPPETNPPECFPPRDPAPGLLPNTGSVQGGSSTGFFARLPESWFNFPDASFVGRFFLTTLGTSLQV